MLSGGERNLIDKLDVSHKRLGDRSLTSAVFVGLQTSADSIYHLQRLATGRYLSKASDAEVSIEDDIILREAPMGETYLDETAGSDILLKHEIS